MNLELTDEEVQTIVNALAELPAKISYNTLTKVVQQQQAELNRRAVAQGGRGVKAVPFEPDAA